MRLSALGILSDYKGWVLLQQAGTNELAPIGRALEPGALPSETLARAFRQETGLIVMPVRLTGLSYSNRQPPGEMSFIFRCTIRGGDLDVPDGLPPAGFFDCPPLPPALPPRFRQPVDQALYHAGGPPVMEREHIGLGERLGRLFGNPAADPGSEEWAVSVRLIVFAGHDEIVWVRSSGVEPWRLPEAPVLFDQAPWETVEWLLGNLAPGRNKLVPNLILVEVAAERPAAMLTFAVIVDNWPVQMDNITVAHPDLVTDQFLTEDARLVKRLDREIGAPVFERSAVTVD